MEDGYRFGNIEVRPEERELRVGGERVGLGARAFDLLLVLIERRGRVIAKGELIEAVWRDSFVEENNLAAQVVALRKALGANAIATIPGRGYQFTLQLDDMPTSPAARLVVRRSNLPATLETLLGRDAELDTLVARIRANRLVQVVGPGGIGKTRLALEVARRCLDEYGQDVSWVDFAAISSTDRIAPAIASATGVRLADGAGIAQLARALTARRALLVLDNCEHLAAEIASAATTMLTAAAEMRLLVTSQEVLRSAGSNIYRLGTLPVPPRGSRLEDARVFPSIQLLEKRARAIDPRFELGAETLAEAIALCTHLDGIPLALEMAAARLPLMGLRALREHLDRHLAVLRNTNVDAIDRQRTLVATLEWSHSLLADDERRVLRYLSAFAGTIRLDTAQFVAGSVGLSGVAAVDALEALVDKSLVQLEQLDPPRYRLLETTRRFAQQELVTYGEAAHAQIVHGKAMARIADEASESVWETNIRHWLAVYMPERPDMDLAFDRAYERRDVDVMAVVGAALQCLDFECDTGIDVRRRKNRLYEVLPNAALPARAQILHSLLWFRYIMPPGANRVDLCREHVAARAAMDDRWELCSAWSSFALHLAGAGRMQEAVEALDASRALVDPQWSAPRRQLLAFRDSQVGLYCRDERMVRIACETMSGFGSWLDDPRMTAHPEYTQAKLALVTGSGDAVPLLLSVSDGLRRLNRPRMLAYTLAMLCHGFVRAGDLDRASAAVREVLGLGERTDVSLRLDPLALLASSTGRCAESARLLGFGDAAYERIQDCRMWPEAQSMEEAQALNERTLGLEDARRLRSDGRKLTPAEAFALAGKLLGAPVKREAVA